MIITKLVRDTRAHLLPHRIVGRKIALVPTMGALHEGHLSLVKKAHSHAEVVAMSVFVNPIQFNSQDDLKSYPRDLDTDCRKAEEAGVDLLFAPEQDEIFPDCSSATCRVSAGKCAQGLCGDRRPGHFDGVTTIVTILFNIIQPQAAVFGMKDYQQLKVIEELTRSLHLNIAIIPAPIIRAPDGLALSSRNLLLNSEQRQKALFISRALFAVQELVSKGESCASACLELAVEILEGAGIAIDYIAVVNQHTLQPLDKIEERAQLLVAGYVGGIRLIDNIELRRVPEHKKSRPL